MAKKVQQPASNPKPEVSVSKSGKNIQVPINIKALNIVLGNKGPFGIYRGEKLVEIVYNRELAIQRVYELENLE